MKKSKKQAGSAEKSMKAYFDYKLKSEKQEAKMEKQEKLMERKKEKKGRRDCGCGY
jgi:hypothetical protein